MVAFSVYKASKYLFDCVGVTDAAAGAQMYPAVRLDELEALRIEAVDVIKRLDFAEVDRLIACCRQHPPQVVVGPLTDGDTTAFQNFAQYLKNRQRAGVCTLPDGCLLLLSPLEHDNLQLRVVAVKAKTNAQENVSNAPPSMTSIRVEAAEPQTKASNNSTSSQATEPTIKNARRARQRQKKRVRQEEIPDTMRGELANQTSQQVEGSTSGGIVLLRDLPRLERVTYIAQLRQEYEAFNDFHFNILQKWCAEDPGPGY